MDFSDQNVTDAMVTAAATAKRGVKGITIGDRRIDYVDPIAQIESARVIQNDADGGIFTIEPTPKGYFQ